MAAPKTTPKSAPKTRSVAAEKIEPVIGDRFFTAEQIKLLSSPLDAKHVAQRSQAGRKLSYIEGWHAIAEANRIFGHGAWWRETVELNRVAERERKLSNGNDGWSVTYLARVRITVTVGDTILAREGCGAGHGIDRDLGLAHESALKEAETDAMKRALMTFGWPFGLALYDKSQENVSNGEEPQKMNGKTNGAAPPAASSTLSETASKETVDKLIARFEAATTMEVFALVRADFGTVMARLTAADKERGSETGKVTRERLIAAAEKVAEAKAEETPF